MKAAVQKIVSKLPVLRGRFNPSDCVGCRWNHDSFADAFDKSGHCYMHSDTPRFSCTLRESAIGTFFVIPGGAV